MNNKRKFFYTICGALTLVATIALAAGGFDRLKDTVKIGQGTATNKVIEFDIGAGSNPKITADGTTGLISFTSTGGLAPVGSILAFAGSTAPTGWLLADGTAVSRTTYATLFALVGTTYGVGNGSTTFNLPDLRSRYGIGKDAGSVTNDALGETGGNASSAHTHSVTSNVTVATQPTFTANSHTHNFAHAHMWGHQNLSDIYGLTAVDDSSTVIDNSDQFIFNYLTVFQTGVNATAYKAAASGNDFFTTGALSPPSGSGSSAVTATASANGTTRTADVALTNPAVTSAGASVTENRPPFVTVNYIVKI